MLITIFASIYISILCWSWGYLLIQLFKLFLNKPANPLPVFSIICITGLSLIAVLAGFCSLLMPLGGISIHIMLVAPILFLWIKNKNVRSIFVTQINTLFFRNNYLLSCFVLLSLITVLIMNTWTISHPDTLAYHLQTKQWIEDYKAVPGLVHLNIHYGYQGMWYVLCALLSFKFIHVTSPTFINSTVIFWYILFMAKQMNDSFIAETPQKKLGGIFYIILFGVSALDYGQVRLTCTSLSPDFVAGLYVWLIFYLLFDYHKNGKNILSLMLIVFLSTTAITIKISTIAVMLLLLYALYHLFLVHKKAAAWLIIVAIITVTPFLTRNIIASGYLIFPSTFPDIASVNWKLSKENTKLEKDYITAYAKTGLVTGKENIEAAAKMQIADWLPVWWRNRSNAEKLYLLSFIFLLPASIVLSVNKSKRAYYRPFIIVCITSVAGIIFWIINAPDPRFAYGFLIPFQGICLYYLVANYTHLFKHLQRVLQWGLAIFSIIIGSYTVYRCVFYFKPANIYTPSGVIKIPYRQVYCNGIKINTPLNNSGYGDIPVPCLSNCNVFILRGKEITDGFLAPVNNSTR